MASGIFFTLVKGPRRSLRLKLSDTRVHAPQVQARLGTAAHFCEVVVLKPLTPHPTTGATLTLVPGTNEVANAASYGGSLAVVASDPPVDGAAGLVAKDFVQGETEPRYLEMVPPILHPRYTKSMSLKCEPASEPLHHELLR